MIKHDDQPNNQSLMHRLLLSSHSSTDGVFWMKDETVQQYQQEESVQMTRGPGLTLLDLFYLNH